MVEKDDFAAAKGDGVDAVLITGIENGDGAIAAAAHGGLGGSIACDLERNETRVQEEDLALSFGEARKNEGDFVRIEDGVVTFDAIDEGQLAFSGKRSAQ